MRLRLLRRRQRSVCFWACTQTSCDITLRYVDGQHQDVLRHTSKSRSSSVCVACGPRPPANVKYRRIVPLSSSCSVCVWPLPLSLNKQVKGFEKDKLAVCTLLFEGDQATVDDQQAKILAFASKHGGLTAGEGMHMPQCIHRHD